MIISNVVGIEVNELGVFLVVLWQDIEYRFYLPKNLDYTITIDNEDEILIE